jgi:TonB family protein
MKVLRLRGLARMVHEHGYGNRLPVRGRTQIDRSAALGCETSFVKRELEEQDGRDGHDSRFEVRRFENLKLRISNTLPPRSFPFSRESRANNDSYPFTGHALLAGVCCLALLCPGLVAPVSSASSSEAATSSVPTKRWTQFELSQEESMGDLQTGKPVTLTIALGGMTSGGTPVVAICESIMFQAQMVTLEQDAESVLKGMVTLEPILMSRTSVPPRAARIQVTFALSRQDKLQRFMRRIVYVTMDHSESANESSELPPLRPEESHSEDVILDEVKPAVEPVSTGALAEEDLVPFASPREGEAYWQQVSHLISRSWSRQVRGIRHAPSSETVKVRFKMFPNGRAQLIEIEKGSGAREIDEAGIYAVVNAQPFLPFPSELGEDAMDVHVRMRTGSRGRSLDVQSVGSRSSSKPDASGQPSKK